jgi:diguanylate cyclase (GGDEF)-like protein
MSGIRLVSEARSIAGARRPLYIIVMSSSDERSKMIQALDGGADDFISKPPAPEELRARLRAADRITSMQAELISLATIDSLTGLLTRRAFVEVTQALLRKAEVGCPLSMLICDLDKFKAINDEHGHPAGDLVLKKFGEVAKSLDIPAGRLGGEEIGLLSERRLDDAVELAEKLRGSVEALAIRVGEETIQITCSIGVAESVPDDTIDALMRRADVSLYEAKRLGRNRVVVADSFSALRKHEQWTGVARMVDRATDQAVRRPG